MTTPDDEFRELLVTAFDCFPMPVVIIGLDGRFLHANPALCRILGEPLEQLRKHSITDYFADEQRGITSDLAEAILDRRLDHYREERVLLRPDGRKVHLDVTGAVLRSAGGKPRAIVALGREILPAREIAKEEVELHEQNVDRLSHEEVAAAAPDPLTGGVLVSGSMLREEFDTFCRTVSQQFRIPLRIIEGYSDIVLEDCGAELDEVALRYMNTIREQSRRLSALIDNTLALAKITSRPLHRESLDLSAVALDAAAVIRAESHAHEVEVFVEPGLKADADASLAGRLLRRLFDNAFRFSRASEEPRVEFGRDIAQGSETFYVRDNGSGFDPAQADQLFLPFETAQEASEHAGAGVGLAEVKRIVARHGGKVWAEAEPGGGATFYFTLPSPPASPSSKL